MPDNPFYKSPDWRRLRAAFLRSRPVCSVPGCGAKATHVDHRQSIRAGGAALDPANLVAYCASHHNSKTARQDRPTMARSDAPLKARGCTADGLPRDPTHPWSRGRGV